MCRTFSAIREIADLPVELRDLCRELVDLPHSLLHARIEVRSLRRQVICGGVEGRSDVPCGRQNPLPERSVRGTGRELIKAVKKVGDGSSDIARGRREIALCLREGKTRAFI